MRKSILLLSCSFLFIAQAHAADVDPILDDASEHLKLVKETYTKKFEQIDANKDGSIDKDEYLKHQFEAMREVVLTTSGFEDIKEKKEPQKIEVIEDVLELPEEETDTAPENAKNLNDFSATLEEMASFDLDFEEELVEAKAQNKKRLTKEDVMPDMSEETIVEEPEKEETLDEASADIDELLKEDEELNELISKTEKQLEEAKQVSPVSKAVPVKTVVELKQQVQSIEDTIVKPQIEEVDVVTSQSVEVVEATKEEKINKIIEESKKNLPQKIDDITTCTDIFYKDDMIVYNYSVNMDISLFPEEEIVLLRDHIKTEACQPIYKEKCPEIAPVFIKEGTNVKINYIDKNGREISYCELNSTTCK